MEEKDIYSDQDIEQELYEEQYSEEYPEEEYSDEEYAETEEEYPEYDIPEDLDLEQFYVAQNEPLTIGGVSFNLADRAEMANVLQGYVRYTKQAKARDKDIMLAKSFKKAGIDESNANDLINAFSGGAEGLAYYMYKHGIDLYTLSEHYSNFSAGASYNGYANHLIDEPNHRLQETISEVLETPSGTEAMNLIYSWDDTSKMELLKQPIIVHTVNNAAREGLLNKILTLIDQKDVKGLYVGLSDVQKFMDAFREVTSEFVQEDYQQVSKQRSKAPKSTGVRKASSPATRASIPRKGGSLRPKKVNINNLTSEEILRMKHEDFVKLLLNK